MMNRIYQIVIIVLVILLCIKTCNSGKKQDPAPMSKIRVDTVKGGVVVSYVPIPYKTFIKGETTQLPPDTVSTIEYVYMNDGDDYDEVTPKPITSPINNNEINLYKDTLRFDSLGYAVVRDSIAGRILKRDYSYSLNKYTVTNTLPQKKRNEVYLGLDLLGNRHTQNNYVGLGLSLKHKRGVLIETGAGFMNREVFYKAGLKFKL